MSNSRNFSTLASNVSSGGSISTDNILGSIATQASANTVYLQGVAENQNTNISGAYSTANTKLSSSGGTISGSLVITENVTISGNTTANLDAASITTGTVNVARLASGTANANTFLAGDNTWKSPLPGAGQVNMIMLDSGSSTGNGAMIPPRGNTAQRPSNPVIGMLRYNTDNQVYENYTNQGWLKVSVPIPIIASITGTIYSGNTSTITINGSNFESTQGTITFQISGSSPVNVSATPNAGGTQVSCLVPSGIYSAVSGGTTVSVTYTNGDYVVSSPYSMTVVGLPTGGTITSSGGYRYHAFTSSGTLVVPTGFSSTGGYLIVAGGGGASRGDYATGGGGGGAGGVVSGNTSFSVGNYSVVVGAGGAGMTGSNSGGNNGSNSTLTGSTAAVGGGYGATYPSTSAATGGSGGGGSWPLSGSYTGAGGSGTSGQGYSGGTHDQSSQPSGSRRVGAGGGGAGGNGESVPTAGGNRYAGAGGIGTSAFSSWGLATSTGHNVSGTYYFAGGGGGGASDWTDFPSGGYIAGTGGNGGGGNGSYSSGQNNSIAGSPGMSNTGGGAGGSAFNGSSASAQGITGANGGSGVVLIRYQI